MFGSNFNIGGNQAGAAAVQDSSSYTLAQLNQSSGVDQANRRNSHSTNPNIHKPLLRGLHKKHHTSNTNASVHNIVNPTKDQNSYSQTLDAIHQNLDLMQKQSER